MNELIKRINKMAIAQTMIIDHASNWIKELDTKIEEMELDLEDTF